jgi:hypothetical protein
MSAEWRTLVSLEGMMWGDLRQLVDMASWLADEDEVEFDYSADNEIYAVSVGKPPARSDG